MKWFGEATKSWRFWLVALSCLTVAFANVAAAPKRLPFTKGNHDFNVAQIIENTGWVEAAPVVLTNHFRKVSVSHVGDRFENGFGFERELVGIFGIASVQRATDPIDVRDRLTAAELAEFEQYRSEVHCSGRNSKYCDFQLIWDSKHAPRDARFIGLLTTDNSYALIEANLLKRLLGDN
ncbi:MAG: hypothetical protein RL670_876 [Actinomycetota bacterium]|jgi:hypothetical protein